MAEYIVSIDYSYQNGPDTCAHEKRYLRVSDDTTVRDLMAWAGRYRKSHNGTDGRQWHTGPIAVQEVDANA